MSGHVATAECEIDAPPDKVWRALTDPELIKRMLAQGVTLTGGTPEQAEAHVQAETKRWGPLIKAAGMKGE